MSVLVRLAERAGSMGKRDGGWRGDLDNDIYVTHTLKGEGFDGGEDGTGRGTPLVERGFQNTGQGWWTESDSAASVRDMSAGGGSREATVVAFANTAGDTALGLSLPGAPPVTTRHGDPGNVLQGMTVRRRPYYADCGAAPIRALLSDGESVASEEQEE